MRKKPALHPKQMPGAVQVLQLGSSVTHAAHTAFAVGVHGLYTYWSEPHVPHAVVVGNELVSFFFPFRTNRVSTGVTGVEGNEIEK